MRACVVVFPGSNADTEMIQTLREAGAKVSVAWHTDVSLPAGTDIVAIPGGFAHGDYLRCGAIAKVSPVIGAIRQHAERGGWVLGVCNGFQILTEVGLLPGALTRNVHQRFECGDWFVRVCAEGPFTGGAVGAVWRLPIAHGEGRYQASPETLRRLEGEGLVGLRYCTPAGAIEQSANPNGSMTAIAGIYNSRKNVFGLMPHPERAADSALGNDDGKKLFAILLASAA